MNKKYTTIKNCRLCKSKEIKTIKKFGNISLANSYVKNINDDEDHFPLTLIRCEDCGHIQIKETVDPNLLFKNYIFKSSDSEYLRKYFASYAKEVSQKLVSNKVNNLLEIGCNCGVLLNEFKKLNLCDKYVGVDPASNIIKQSNEDKIDYYNDFFNLGTAKKLSGIYGNFSLIVANNVLAHVDKLDSIIVGIKEILLKDGVFILENAYALSTIKNLYFDQVYHEHLQYYSVKPLNQYLNTFGLEIFDVEWKETQGGSIRCFIKHIDSKKNKVKKSVSKFIKNETDYGLYDEKCFIEFIDRLNVIKKDVTEFLKKAKKENKIISCYGCPAKFALFCKFFGLNKNNIKYVVDDTPGKQGRVAPYTKIPIVNNKYFYDNPTDYNIVSAWNVADFIINKNKNYKGKFVIIMPSFEIKSH